MERVVHSPPRSNTLVSQPERREVHRRTPERATRHSIEVVERAPVLTNLLKSTTDFLCSRQTRIEGPGLVEPETWQVVAQEKQNKATFRNRIDAHKQAVDSEFDSLIRNFTEAVNNCRNALKTKLDNVSANYENDYDSFVHDVKVYCDKARRILEEEKSNLVSEVRTSIQDPWTKTHLGENVQIVARHCLETDVDRAYGIIKGARENSRIDENGSKLIIALDAVATALINPHFQQLVDTIGCEAVSRLNNETATTSSVADPSEAFPRYEPNEHIATRVHEGVGELIGQKTSRVIGRTSDNTATRRSVISPVRQAQGSPVERFVASPARRVASPGRVVRQSFQASPTRVSSVSEVQPGHQRTFVNHAVGEQGQARSHLMRNPDIAEYISSSINHNVREFASPGTTYTQGVTYN